MLRLLDHIDRHLDDDLGLAKLSGESASSMRHFHRQFRSAFGIPVNRYGHLARAKQACDRLGDCEWTNVTEIALKGIPANGPGSIPTHETEKRSLTCSCRSNTEPAVTPEVRSRLPDK
jgi:hypothetical protein